MKTHRQTGTWIFRAVVVLSVILTISMICMIVLILTDHSIPGVLVALGWVTGAGLAKLMISPLCWRL